MNSKKENTEDFCSIGNYVQECGLSTLEMQETVPHGTKRMGKNHPFYAATPASQNRQALSAKIIEKGLVNKKFKSLLINSICAFHLWHFIGEIDASTSAAGTVKLTHSSDLSISPIYTLDESRAAPIL